MTTTEAAAERARKTWRASETPVQQDARRLMARAYAYREMEDDAFRAGYLSALTHQEALTGRVGEALRDVDAAISRCPCNKSSIGVDECPKCGASQSDTCGIWVTAVYGLETAVRQALAPTSTTPGETDGR